MIRVDETAMSEWIDIEIERLERLLADLKRIRARAAPTAADLDGTPVIDGYRIARRDVLCLVGEVTGHPRLGNRNTITTELWLFAPTLGWARTLSRFYRLGQPIDEANDEVDDDAGDGAGGQW